MDTTLAIVTAVATVALAVVAALTLKENSRLIRANIQEASAATAMVKEIQTDRSLTWRPYVMVSQMDALSRSDSYSEKVRLINVGQGPALSCVYAAKDPRGLSCQSPVVHLGAGGSTLVTASPVDPGTDSTFFDLLATRKGTQEWTHHVVSCSSALGYRYRFGFRQEKAGLKPWGLEELPPLDEAEAVE